MARAHVFHHHPFPLREWLREHGGLASSGLSLIAAIVIVGIAVAALSMVRAGIAGHVEPSVEGTQSIPAAELPREWTWSREPITFDHMFRQGKSQAVVDFVRSPVHPQYRSSAE